MQETWLGFRHRAGLTAPTVSRYPGETLAPAPAFPIHAVTDVLMDEHTRKSVTGCPLCPPREAINEHRIEVAPLRVSTLYLFRDQRFRGYCLLVFDLYHATRLPDLLNEEYQAFMLDLRQAGAALQQALQPDHMNYECLGNSGPHLHWHVVPRYKTDPRWGQPIWEGWPRNEFTIHRVTIRDREYDELVSAIRSRL